VVWWKQLLIVAAAIFAGMTFMLACWQVWFERHFGPPGQPLQYGPAAEEIGTALVILAAALFVANWSRSKRV
jgi:hypothetical protein